MAKLKMSRGIRLDQKVVELIPELSRAFAARLIAEGKVRVRGAVETKAGYKLREHDEVKVEYDVAELEEVADIELDVLYEDDDCVVINKPLGLLVHSKGAYNPEPTVATWLRSRVSGVEGNRAGIVHRLDRATGGVMICAKTPEALSWLQKQFAQRRTKKTYYAVIQGTMKPEEAIIDMPIERNPKAPATFRVGPHGKTAKTHYKTIAVSSDGKYSLVELKPETGRTHQLRVHLAHFGHPIVGDEFYGGEKADRLYLHAAELEITIVKDHERKVFKVELPQSFNDKVS
jgi:23S rRNA pseudouridine1911/1915/1917 synthase